MKSHYVQHYSRRSKHIFQLQLAASSNPDQTQLCSYCTVIILLMPWFLSKLCFLRVYVNWAEYKNSHQWELCERNSDWEDSWQDSKGHWSPAKTQITSTSLKRRRKARWVVVRGKELMLPSVPIIAASWQHSLQKYIKVTQIILLSAEIMSIYTFCGYILILLIEQLPMKLLL